MENKKAAHPIINLLVVLIREIGMRVAGIFIFFLFIGILVAFASGDWTPVWNFLRAVF